MRCVKLTCTGPKKCIEIVQDVNEVVKHWMDNISDPEDWLYLSCPWCGSSLSDECFDDEPIPERSEP